MDTSSDKECNRRDALRMAASVGALGTVTSVPGVVAGSTGKEVEIVTHVSQGKPVKTKTVPKSWVQHLEAARRAKQQITKQHRENSAVKIVSLIRSKDTFGGKRGFTIKIEVAPNQTSPNVPSQANGIPTKIQDFTERIPQYCTGDDSYDDLPGGVIIGGGATTGCRVHFDYDSDGTSEGFLWTAAHIFGSDVCDYSSGTTVYQKGDPWGHIKVDNVPNDSVFVRPKSGYSIDGQINETNESLNVAGYVSKSGLADMVADGVSVYKTGIRTGTNEGTVIGTGVTDMDRSCVDYEDEGVNIDVYTLQGDSGGPIYDEVNGNAYMIGITSTGHRPTSYPNCELDDMLGRVEGPSAYHIANMTGGYFD